MGPLVPFVLSSEFGLVLAIIIGIGFGYILEQAGFSSTKKLVGLFYGYDFTVLRVFFTAGVTAMIGVVLLSRYGLLDIEVIYVNPTFLRSALVGGAIMGVGFIVGGFCPGTSVCAAAIGKLDAMAFILGSIIGVYIFFEGYPLYADFYAADDMGPVTMFEQIGVSRMVFAFMLTIVALAAFYFTWRLENKINGRDHAMEPIKKRNYMLAIASPLVILIFIAAIPSKQNIIQHKIAKAQEQRKCVFFEISADKLAYEITNNYYKLNIIDVRSPEEYAAYHLPMAINIPFDEIQNREWENYFKQQIKTNVFYAGSDTLVKMSCLKAKHIGKSQNWVLQESPDEFKAMFFDLDAPAANASKSELEIYNFRTLSAVKMMDLVKSLENIGKPVKKEIKKVKGGCS